MVSRAKQFVGGTGQGAKRNITDVTLRRMLPLADGRSSERERPKLIFVIFRTNYIRARNNSDENFLGHLHFYYVRCNIVMIADQNKTSSDFDKRDMLSQMERDWDVIARKAPEYNITRGRPDRLQFSPRLNTPLVLFG